MESLINYTNERISDWYETVKNEYGVIGSGKARCVNGDEIIIDYIEDGQEKTWSICFYEQSLKDFNINYVFNCWAEQG